MRERKHFTKARKNGKIITFDAQLLIAKLGLLFNDGARTSLHWMDGRVVESDVVKKIATVWQNALLDQIVLLLGNPGATSADQDPVYCVGGSSTKWLVFVDFSSLFGNGGLGRRHDDEFETEFEAATKRLVEDGFSIVDYMDGKERVWHYSVFDKSANQARHSVISFVADRGYGELSDEPIEILGAGGGRDLDRRLCLGLDFAHACKEWSKYFAYRGLFLSSGRRIDAPELVLNEDTVLVLEPIGGSVDRGQIPKGVMRLSLDSPPENNCERANSRDELNMKLKLFDGEGIVSPAYAEVLRSCLPGNKKDVHTFQIRMPFTKGMLHEVDFHEFLRHEVQLESGMRIKDAFGIERNLDNVQIILSAEMFKCLGWLETLRNEKMLPCKDPMEAFFRGFDEYNHALYITRPVSGPHSLGKTILNNQFLSTLKIDPDEFDEFARSCMDFAISALDDADAARMLLIGEELGEVGTPELGGNDRRDLEGESRARDNSDDLSQDDESDQFIWDYMDEEEDDNERTYTTWQRALMKSKRFVEDPFIKSQIVNEASSKLLRCSIGYLEAEGGIFTLSHDLLRLLVELAEKALYSSSIPDGKRSKSEEHIKRLKEHCLGPDDLYAPGLPQEKVGERGYCGILRNPHLSRSEQCALKPRVDKDALYERYLAQLSAVVMVSCESAAPVVLGGADFDGDIVRVLWDRRVVKAILDGAYENAEGTYQRRFPVVEMDLAGMVPADEQPVGDHISYDQLKLTFSNHIGMISNAAMRKARDAYGYRVNEQPGEVDSLQDEDPCAAYSVITGMEIDAVKTGADLTGILNVYCPKADPRNDKRERFGHIQYKKDEYGELTRRKPLLQCNYEIKKNKGQAKYLCFSGKSQLFATPDLSYRDKWDAEFAHKAISNIDRLPWLMLDEMFEYEEERKSVKNDAADIHSLFSFEEYKAWEAWVKQLDEDVIAKIEMLHDVYCTVLKERKKFIVEQRELEERNDFSKACNVMRANPQAGALGRANADAELRTALFSVENYFATREKPTVEEVLGSLKSKDYTGWPFIAPEERTSYLSKLMPGFEYDDHFRNTVLENDYKNGFMILFYLLRTAERNIKLNEMFDLKCDTDAYDDMAKEFLDSLISITKESIWKMDTTDEWRGRAVTEFRERLKTILQDEKLSELVKYLEWLRASPSYLLFSNDYEESGLFWFLLEWDEVDKYIVEDAPMSVAYGGNRNAR